MRLNTHLSTLTVIALLLAPSQVGRAISLKPDQVKNLPLTNASAAAEPNEQFAQWFEKAKREDKNEPGVFVLATASRSGIPSSRTMMLKSYDKKGFVFFSSSQSFKALEMRASPYASLTFYWPEQQRQVNVRGQIELLSKAESDEYFTSRTRESQVASWASAQGSALESREQLHNKFAELQKVHEGKPVPVPPHWQGYRVVPSTVEFWQAGPHTLHDRVFYQLKNGKWWSHALSP
jgi:pyridoxamine 5'-phosphate oxidase